MFGASDKTTISDEGVFNVNALEGNSHILVTATREDNPNITDAAVVQVLDRTSNGVHIQERTVHLKRGDSFSFHADISVPADADKAISWGILGGSSSSKIDKNGVLTIGNNESNGALFLLARLSNAPDSVYDGVLLN